LYLKEKPEPGASKEENWTIANKKNMVASLDEKSLKYRV